VTLVTLGRLVTVVTLGRLVTVVTLGRLVTLVTLGELATPPLVAWPLPPPLAICPRRRRSAAAALAGRPPGRTTYWACGPTGTSLKLPLKAPDIWNAVVMRCPATSA
jgi:hypothetical protein